MKKHTEFVYDVAAVTTFRELMARSAELYTDRIAFLYYEGDALREVTYGQAYRDMIAFATYLRSRLPEGCKIAVTGKPFFVLLHCIRQIFFFQFSKCYQCNLNQITLTPFS